MSGRRSSNAGSPGSPSSSWPPCSSPLGSHWSPVVRRRSRRAESPMRAVSGDGSPISSSDSVTYRPMAVARAKRMVRPTTPSEEPSISARVTRRRGWATSWCSPCSGPCSSWRSGQGSGRRLAVWGSRQRAREDGGHYSVSSERWRPRHGVSSADSWGSCAVSPARAHARPPGRSPHHHPRSVEHARNGLRRIPIGAGSVGHSPASQSWFSLVRARHRWTLRRHCPTSRRMWWSTPIGWLDTRSIRSLNGRRISPSRRPTR